MKKNSDFVEHILDLMKPLGGVSAKRMFGGYGIYRKDKMFALVSDDRLYFKKTISNRGEIQKRNLAPFTYQRKKKVVTLTYYEAPAECLDESRAMVEWAELSIKGDNSHYE